jgi:hypothetical protein
MHETLSLASFVIALAVAVGGGLLRYTVLRSDAERDRRFRGVDDQLAELARVTHKAEVDGVRLEGQLAVLRSEHEANALVLTGIRADTLGRREFDARMNAVDAAFSAVREQLQGLLEALARAEKKPSKLPTRSS